MKFVSTRGRAPALSFSDAVLTGLASDGGLYLPESWPVLSPAEIAAFAGQPYAEVANTIIGRFVGDEIAPEALHGIVADAYAGFRHPSVAPLVEIAPGRFVLELFHGPTLSFKDVAMQFLGRFMDHVLAARNERVTIVGATSGDTGSAAIEAFRGRERADVFILHPLGRTSEVQRRQMTTVDEPNVHNIALEGTFDDCQTLLKGLFNDARFRTDLRLSGVNSINFGRIVSQIVYYFTAAVSLGAPHRPVTFVVPTGNFGDIFAAYAAARMGLPIERLVIATNANDILTRALYKGRYEIAEVAVTSSPSMDIQVSSNFERLLFEAGGRDAGMVEAAMQGLRQSGGFAIPDEALAKIRDIFDAGAASDAEAAQAIAETRERCGYLVDPHTAVGLSVAARVVPQGRTPVVVLSTAHPAKFPAAVAAATGIEPPLPLWLADLMSREERFAVLANDQAAVAAHIRANARAEEHL